MQQRSHGQQTFTDLAVVKLGGPRTAATLGKIDAFVPWTALVAPIRKLPEYAKFIDDPSRPGQRPIDPVVMIKALFLQKLYGLSDPQIEEQLLDRVSFRRFVGLAQADKTPDETPFVKFRVRLREANLDTVIFDTILKAIDKQGLLLKEGTIVDATLLPQARVPQARGRKTCQKDDDGNPVTTRDPQASFTKKQGKTYPGYKLHAATDCSGIITDVITSTAKDHDSQYIDALVEEETRAVLADNAYSDRDRRERVESRGVATGIIYRRARGEKELSGWKKKFNRVVSRIRAVGEHPFAWMKKLMHFRSCRYRGMRRNDFDFVMTTAVYNVKKAVSLLG